jgi:multidrug efflux pump subunit AcrB
MKSLGPAGRIASYFLHSKLTPLMIFASLMLGLLAVIALPREEEPQIIVPMIDVFVQMPGATAKEVEQRVARPMEKLLWEIPGVEYIYSTSSPGFAMAVVRFYVGQDEEKSLVRLNQKLQSNFDLIPPGASLPLVKPRSIDDVPILALNLSSRKYDSSELRKVAAALTTEIKQTPDVSEVKIIGGRRRILSVKLDPQKLEAYQVSALQVLPVIGGANYQNRSGEFASGNTQYFVETSGFIASVEDLGSLVVGNFQDRPVYLRNVAILEDAAEEPHDYVFFWDRSQGSAEANGVTITVAKRKNKNAVTVSEAVLERVQQWQQRALPSDVKITITRHYGETARDKSNELLFHMMIAIFSVTLLIALALGRREAIIVLIAIPVTLALTLAVFYLYGYTLNRITLFALIFSIGILVDDAIVVVENIVRHARSRPGEGGLIAVAVHAVDEVGNPTILATLAVMAAILPMAFVGGLMGPYMRPIPVGASAAMAFSLIVAFVVTPWAAVRLLKPAGHHGQEQEDLLTRVYRRVMGPLITRGRMRVVFLSGVGLLLIGAMAFVPLGLVTVKMLPFDNKSEFQVMVDMPEGTALETTARVTSALASAALEDEAVVDVQQYVGTSAPYNFNGLVRHYFLRRAPHLADLQVNLVPKADRSAQSHDIARRTRDRLLPIARSFGATLQVAEVPPGPPVLQTMVAEVYGPDAARRTEVAAQVKAIFEQTPGVVDTDWYVEAPQPKVTLVVDGEKAAAAGLSSAAVASMVRMAGSGEIVGRTCPLSCGCRAASAGS